MGADLPSTEDIPQALASRPQWVCWDRVERGGKATKVPVDPRTGGAASSTDPATWATLGEALAAAAGQGHAGVGFVFAPDRAVTGVDLDHVLADGELSPAYRALVGAADTYAEVSPSGEGLHLYFLGAKPEEATRCKRAQADGTAVEMYDHGRFFTVTGRAWGRRREPREAPDVVRTAYDAWLGEGTGATLPAAGLPGADLPPADLPEVGPDAAVVARMLASSRGAQIGTLLRGDLAGFHGDRSAADMALCDHLAFWCRRDEAQVDRIFRASGLMRAKWDSRRGQSTYGAQTVARACRECRQAWGEGGAKDEPLAWDSGRGGDRGGAAPLPGGSRFDHAAFGDWLVEHDHMVYVDGAPAVWRDGRYRVGAREVETAMILARRSITQRQRGEVMRYLEHMAPRVPMADPRYIAFENGVLDLKTGGLLEATPDLVVPNVVPHGWDPAAECPELDQALDAWACGREAVRRNLEEVLGLCLWRGRSVTACPVLTGDGANGKSTFVNLLIGAVGEDNVATLDIATIGERFQSTSLVGVLANVGDDIANEFVSGSRMALVKKVVTGDWVPGEYKGGSTFKFRPYCTLVFSCNEMPRLGDASGGMFRRFVPIPFDAHFRPGEPGFDPRLGERLSTEAAYGRAIRLGVGALRGCIGRGGLTPTDAQGRMLDEMRRANSSVWQFACDELGLGGDHAHDVEGEPTGMRFDAYVGYCQAAGCKPVSRNRFSTEMCQAYGMVVERRRVAVPGGGRRLCRVFARPRE